MEREKGVGDGFCSSTSPTKRQLGESYATIDARKVVVKGSVNRHSQSRSPDHQRCCSTQRCRPRASIPPSTSHANCCTPGRSGGRKPEKSTTYLWPLHAASACMPWGGRFGRGRSKLSRHSRRELENCGGAKGHQAPCRSPPATPRTFPDTRNCPSMRLAKSQVAGPTPSMRTAEGGVCIIIIMCAHPSRSPRLQSHDWESGHSRIRN